jgi:predicted AAA+ superfamily ATPase
MSTLTERIQKLKEIEIRLKAMLPAIHRPAYVTLEKKVGRAVLLIGPRGVGKTTYLLSTLNTDHRMYLSVSNIQFFQFSNGNGPGPPTNRSFWPSS